jgi:hypothetical protein
MTPTESLMLWSRTVCSQPNVSTWECKHAGKICDLAEQVLGMDEKAALSYLEAHLKSDPESFKAIGKASRIIQDGGAVSS